MLATALRIRLSRFACRCPKECLIFKFGQGPEVRSQSTKPTPVLQLENIPSFGCAAISAAPQAAPAPGSRSKWFQASLFLPRDSHPNCVWSGKRTQPDQSFQACRGRSLFAIVILADWRSISEQHCSVSTSSEPPPHSSCTIGKRSCRLHTNPRADTPLRLPQLRSHRIPS